jgi:hypothetical protein
VGWCYHLKAHVHPETLTSSHEYQVFVWIYMVEPRHQNMNTINVMQKKSHQFVFTNPYSNAQECCGYLYIINDYWGTKEELT